MRAKKIEKLLSYAGNEHRYQFFVLFLFLFLWANCNFMAVVLPYLEREPLINYYDTKENFHEKELYQMINVLINMKSSKNLDIVG